MNLRRKLIVPLLVLALAAPAAADVAPPIGDVMAGEFALQQGELAAAARSYLLAAQVSDDVGLAERAARIALLSGDARLAERALARWRTLAPESLAMHAATIHLALRQGEHETAMEEALVLLAMPGEAGFPALLATLSEARGDDAVIARSVMRALYEQSRLPNSLAQWLRFAGLARRLGDRAFSDRIVEAGLARFPDDPRAALLEVSRLRQAGEADAARSKLLALRASGELSPDLRRTAAAEMARLGELRIAADLLSEGPQNESTLGQRASWLVAANDRPGMERLLAELQAGGAPGPGRRLLLGHVSEALERWSEAEHWYASVDRGEGRDLAMLRGARVMARQAKLAPALDLLHELQADESADGERVRDSYALESELLEGAGRSEEARGRLDQGLAIFEDDPVLLYARAMLAQRNGRVDAALADLRRIVDDNPGDAQALNAYGYVLADRKGAYAQALPFLQRAFALEPESPPILDSLGWVQLMLGQEERALVLLQQAWDAMKDAEIAAHLGEALWRLGRKDEARRMWDESLKLDADSRAMRRVQEIYRP
ncbi:tetratricopeptide repeat protein [Arenimonas sp. MALMAid1274]|uniref:tetratricopeptide repeat protein n=1 Tax=Arenimonas sp. MALMAid1274 TaxID=3411630 RepID=UPI003BA03E82